MIDCRFWEFEEWQRGNFYFLFRGKLSPRYEDISDMDILYLINGGRRFIKDYRVVRDGLFFKGFYKVLSIFEVRENTKAEIKKKFILIKSKRFEPVNLDYTQTARRKRRSPYVYFIKSESGEVLGKADNLEELSDLAKRPTSTLVNWLRVGGLHKGLRFEKVKRVLDKAKA